MAENREQVVADEHSMHDPVGDSEQPKRRRRPGPKMTAAAKTARDAAIVAAWHAGVDVKEIGRRYELTPGQVRRIYLAWKSRPSALDRSPTEILERLLKSYETQMDVVMSLVAATAETQPNVATGGVKAYVTLLERYTQLLSDTGKLPDNLAQFRQEAEMRRVGEQMVDILFELEAGRVTPVEVREFFERLLTSPGLLIEGTAWEDEPPAEGEAA